MESSDFPVVPVLRFDSADEFRGRSRFRRDVVVPREKPRQIVGSYRLPEPVCCGVSGCEQAHDHGYVVLVDDATETNTGWDCGLDHFGLEFLEMRQHYDRAEREYPQRAALRNWIGESAHFRELIQGLQLRPLGGMWLLRNLRQFDELYPAEFARRFAPQRGKGRGQRV